MEVSLYGSNLEPDAKSHLRGWSLAAASAQNFIRKDVYWFRMNEAMVV